MKRPLLAVIGVFLFAAAAIVALGIASFRGDTALIAIGLAFFATAFLPY